MSGIWGNKVKISIFGESHGVALGITIDGLPSGFEIDLEKISKEMERRAPGRNKLSTARAEKDQFEILSGFFEGRTTGTPLCAIIRNGDKKSKDYSKLKSVMRPGHADYTGYLRYDGFNDYRGGGHFSGRITAPLVFAGALAKQILESKGINIGAHISKIYNEEDTYFNPTDISKEMLEELSSKDFPVIDEEKGNKMQNAILNARSNGDSVGGIVECAIIGLNGGVGDPFFDSIESNISQLVFSIPGTKGIEFGAGFNFSNMKGSEANDPFYYEGDKVKVEKNNNGGILGGISSGMPIVFRTVLKPTSSIFMEQKTINIEEKKNTTLQVVGRHDPCIVARAVPVVESVAALAILNLINY